MLRSWTLAALLATLLFPLSGAAQSQREVPRDEPGQYVRPPAAQEAIDRLKSPYCPGQMLEVCPSPGGAALRDSIAEMAEMGLPSDSIVEWVVGNYGEEYRALPKAEGRSLLAWIVPPLGVLLGLVMVVVVLRKMRAGREVVAPIEGELSEEEERRLREAMKELDKEEEATFF